MPFSNRTYGVEFEFFITREKFCALINQYPEYWNKQQKEEYKHELEYCQRNHLTPTPFLDFIRNSDLIPNHRAFRYTTHLSYKFLSDLVKDVLKLPEWEVKSDCSIEGGLSVEAVTGVLKGIEGLKQIKKFLDFIGPYGQTNQSCGQHVHVGIQNDILNDPKWKKKVAKAIINYQALEATLFDRLVDRTRRSSNNRYTKSNASVEETVEAYSINYHRPAETFGGNIQYDRYRKLNTQSIGVHKTLEFRQMHGNLNYNIVANWVRVVTAFVDYSFSENKDDHLFDEVLVEYDQTITTEDFLNKFNSSLSLSIEEITNIITDIDRSIRRGFAAERGVTPELIKSCLNSMVIHNRGDINSVILSHNSSRINLFNRGELIRTQVLFQELVNIRNTDREDKILKYLLLFFEHITMNHISYVSTFYGASRYGISFNVNVKKLYDRNNSAVALPSVTKLQESLANKKKDFLMSRYVKDATKPIMRLVAE